MEDNVVVKNEIRIDLGQGIAGMVALDGNTLNIPDAYQVCSITCRYLEFVREPEMWCSLALKKSSLYSRCGSCLRLSSWAVQLRRNVAAVVGDTVSNLTGSGIEAQTSRTDSDVFNDYTNRPVQPGLNSLK